MDRHVLLDFAPLRLIGGEVRFRFRQALLGDLEARDAICTICHVRLRPQVFNNVRRNDSIIQCDSCQRILYFAQPEGAPAPASDNATHAV